MLSQLFFELDSVPRSVALVCLNRFGDLSGISFAGMIYLTQKSYLKQLAEPSGHIWPHESGPFLCAQRGDHFWPRIPRPNKDQN